MDIQMPVMDGIDATKEIRKLEKSAAAPSATSSSFDLSDSNSQGTRSTPSTPFHSSVIIVALTASSLQSDRVRALAAGCNDFLTKPVSLHWLDKKIVEWGSIKALQMWATAELKSDVQEEQKARARAINVQLPAHLGAFNKGLNNDAPPASGTVTPTSRALSREPSQVPAEWTAPVGMIHSDNSLTAVDDMGNAEVLGDRS